MNKKNLKRLAKASYTNNELDPQKVSGIADKLSRSQLKQYIDYLKQEEVQRTVFITTPLPPTDREEQKFKELFPDKKIVYFQNPNLLLGYTVRNNDLITEYNLKSALEEMAELVNL